MIKVDNRARADDRDPVLGSLRKGDIPHNRNEKMLARMRTEHYKAMVGRSNDAVTANSPKETRTTAAEGKTTVS